MRILSLLLLLPLAACGDSAQNDLLPTEAVPSATEQSVQAHFEGYPNGVKVASVSCDAPVETPSAEAGAVVERHSCMVEQTDGDAFEAEFAVQNSDLPDGEAEQTFTTPGTLLVSSSVMSAITSSFLKEDGGSIAVNCDGPRAVPSTPGDTIDCQVADDDGSHDVLVTITDSDGGFDFDE